MTDRMVAGVLQPDGRKIPEPRMDAKAVGDASPIWRACRSTPIAVHDRDGEQNAVRGTGVDFRFPGCCAARRPCGGVHC